MKILVEFIDPITGEKHETIMEGPDMDPTELKESVMETLSSITDIDPEKLSFKITELAHGTIH